MMLAAQVIAARVMCSVGMIAGSLGGAVIADEPAQNRTVQVSGTGTDLLNAAIVHSKKPTATGVIQRSTEIVELSGDLTGAYSGDGDRCFRFIVTGLARSEVLGVDDNSVGHDGRLVGTGFGLFGGAA